MLAQAAAELNSQGYDRSESSGSGMFNGNTFTGLAMVIGALIWFFVGLVAGVIFFYPPILLILGLIQMGRGLLGDAGD